MTTLIQDLKFGLRMLAKNPGFTAVAVLTLALGIGANSTIFSWIDSTLLNPIPGGAHTSGLVTVMRGERTEHPTPPFSYLDYLDLREHTQSFSGLLAYHDDFMSLTGTDKPERIYGALASANYFDVLGVRPILGRGFLPGEEYRGGGASVAVISEAMWRARFGFRPVHHWPDDSDQPALVHHHRSGSAGISGMQDGFAGGRVDSAGDGPNRLGLEPPRGSRCLLAQCAGKT